MGQTVASVACDPTIGVYLQWGSPTEPLQGGQRAETLKLKAFWPFSHKRGTKSE